MAGDVHARGVVLLVADARGDGEPGNVALAVVHDGVDVRREHGLGALVDGHRRIRPPEEGLGHWRPVVEPRVDADVGLVRVKREAGHALGAEHVLDLADHNGAASVLVFADGPVHGVEGAGPVMLGPVELDAAADPRADQAHQRRLDDVVAVNEIAAVCLVIGRWMRPPSSGRIIT